MHIINPYVYGLPAGQQVFTSSGTFTVPDGVTTISAVCVGGGAAGSNRRGGDLRYSSSIAVTPGESLTVNVNSGGVTEIKRSSTVLLAAKGGSSGTSSTVAGNIGGGNGGNGGSDYTTSGSAAVGGGGGGAGGYTGNGGAGGNGGEPGSSGANGSGGGGGGGGGGAAPTAFTDSAGGDGGGVGLLGTGSNGTGGTSANPGNAGSAGSSGSGRTYGGGAKGGAFPGPAQTGACRIIWGTGRAYPSTNTADV